LVVGDNCREGPSEYFPIYSREPAMKTETQSTIYPGNIIFGKRSLIDQTGEQYKIIFCCKKSGFDYLGQIKILASETKLKVELFNAGYFERFEAEHDEVQLALETKVLTALLQQESITETFRSIVRPFLSDIRRRRAQMVTKPVAPEADKNDLSAIYERLNEQYFNGSLAAEIQWGKDSKTPNRRSFSFGSYDAKKKLIRIHPRLKQDFVPTIVLELTVYHEMCHQFHPPFKSNGQWRTHHEKFKLKEREYEHYREAMAWEKINWIKLLKPAQDEQDIEAIA
jgi:predicted SprT family Zn-dependent metalloprotease